MRPALAFGRILGYVSASGAPLETTQRGAKDDARTKESRMSNQNDQRDRAGLEDVIRAAARLAEQLRDVATTAGTVAEREAAMLATIAEDLRDRVIAAQRLESARKDEVLAGLRRSAHRGVDVAFDIAGTMITAASDAFGAFVSAPRKSEPRIEPARPNA